MSIELFAQYQSRLTFIADPQNRISQEDLTDSDRLINKMFFELIPRTSAAKLTSVVDFNKEFAWRNNLPIGYGFYRCPSNGLWHIVYKSDKTSAFSLPVDGQAKVAPEDIYQFGLGYIISWEMEILSQESPFTRKKIKPITPDQFNDHSLWVSGQIIRRSIADKQ